MKTPFSSRPVAAFVAALPALLCSDANSFAAPSSTKALATKSFRAAQAEAEIAVAGTVLGQDDKPVADALVAVSGYSRSKGFQPQVVKTDARGRFTAQVEAVPARFRDRAGDAIGRVLIAAPGLALGDGVLKKGDNTFHLQAGRAVSGTVVDEAGKPVEGTRVRLRFFMQREEGRFVSLDNSGALGEKFVARTGADGRWTMDGLPASGAATLQLDDDAYGNAYASADLEDASSIVAPIVAKVGARVVGRVLLPGGAPLVGVKVMAGREGEGSQGYGDAVTDKNGRYRISGLDTGTFKMTASENGGEWVAPAVAAKTQTGKTTQAADIVMGHGMFVEGTFVDADTREPVADGNVGAQGPHGFSSSTDSDKNGRFRVRVVPGEIRFYLYGVPPGYLRDENTDFTDDVDFKVNVVAGQKPLAPIRLKKGLTLSGTAVDENGHLAVGVVISAGDEMWNATQATIDDKGAWKMRGVAPGNRRHGETEDEVRFSVAGEWQIVSPQKLKVPIEGDVHLVLRRIKLANLRGRVVSPDGKPLEGVTLNLQIAEDESRSGWMNQQKTSDANGSYSVRKLRPEGAVSIKARKFGYKFVKGGAVTKKDGVFSADDIVMTPLSATFAGRAVDAAGASLSGAEAIAIGVDPVAIATSDAEGRFVIASLPAGTVRVLVARGYDVGETTGEAKTDGAATVVTLTHRTPPPASSVERAVSILEELSKSSDEEDRKSAPHLATLLAAYDPDTALRLATAKDGAISDNSLTDIIARLSKADPKRAALWAPPQLEKVRDMSTHARAELDFAIAIAQVAPEQATAILRRARTSLKPTDFSLEAASIYGRIASLAGRLGLPESGKLADLVTVSIEHSSGADEIGQNTARYAALVADGGAELVRRLIANLDAKDRVRALEDAIPVVARRDAKGAQALLGQMEAAMKIVASESVEAPPQRDATYRPTPDQSYAVAAFAVVKALGPTDPQAALDIARKIRETPYVYYSRASVLALAARFQKPEVAAQLLDEASQAAGADTFDITSRIAMLAWDIDPKLGEALFARIKTRTTAAQRLDEEEMRPSFASYAFYRAAVDPAESRLLLESEWARRATNAAGDDYGRAQRLRVVAQAMVAVDVERALEMARAVPDNYGARSNVYAQIIGYVLASEKSRRVMSFQEHGEIAD